VTTSGRVFLAYFQASERGCGINGRTLELVALDDAERREALG